MSRWWWIALVCNVWSWTIALALDKFWLVWPFLAIGALMLLPEPIYKWAAASRGG